jgi:hypothetical protein
MCPLTFNPVTMALLSCSGMRYIIKYLKDFLKAESNTVFYLIMLVFFVLTFYINYHYDFEDRYIESTFRTPAYFWLRLSSYALPYYFTAIAYAICKKKYSYLKSSLFWIKSGMILMILSWGYAAYSYAYDLSALLPIPAQYYGSKLLFNAVHIVSVMVPLGFYYILFEKERSNFYGFRIKGINLRPYFYMLLIMLALIGWASFQADFMNAYPTYRPGMLENAYHLHTIQTESVYEVLYCLDFTTIELIYRGFMVIGMAAIMGRAAVFPMVATYAFLHFGKPMAEAISSIAGGFILGIIAYYTRSIFGGIIIHAGIALGMDVAALAQLSWISK